MTIREFNEEDRDALRMVYLETRLKIFTWLNGNSLAKEDFDRDTEGERIWVCEHNGEIVGFISLWEPENFIHTFFVLPEFCGLGYGSQLLKACMNNAGHPVKLKCSSFNTKALQFYRSKGWKTISTGNNQDGEYQLMQATNN